MSVTFHRDGPLGTVVLNRPGARNAVNPATARALYGAFVQFDRAPAAAVAVLFGAGGAFCAGAERHGQPR